MNDIYKQVSQLLKQRLTPQRYTHSLGVAKTAASLAQVYHADIEVCRFSGLVHDITKDVDFAGQLSLLKQYGIDVTECLLFSPGVLHAITGAYFVQNELHIQDKRIFDSVRYHTTGRRGMSLYELILYVADLIEPTRNYKDVDRLRKLSRIDLSLVAYEGVKFCIMEHIERNTYIYPDTFDFYNECIEKRLKNGI